jgi:hypothetical protein
MHSEDVPRLEYLLPWSIPSGGSGIEGKLLSSQAAKIEDSSCSAYRKKGSFKS